MPVGFRSSQGFASAFGGGATTTTAPAGVTSGDLLAAMCLVAKEGAAAPTPPAGWSMAGVIAPAVGTRAGANGAAAVFWKAAGASEPASYSWTFPATTAGMLWALTDADLITPIDVDPAWLTGSSTAMDTSSIGVTDGACVLVGYSTLNGSNTQTFTTPAGMSADGAQRAGSYINGGFFHQANVGAGGTGSKASTVSPAPSNYPTQSGIVAVRAAKIARPSAFFPFF